MNLNDKRFLDNYILAPNQTIHYSVSTALTNK